MAAPQTLGKKRNCPSCLAKFYDLDNNPATCPKCDFTFDTNVILRRRKVERKTEDTGEDLLVAAANKAKASMLRKGSSDEVDDLDDIEDVEGLDVGAEIEEVDDLDEMEVIDELDSEDEDEDEDGMTLEKNTISGEKIVDDFEEDMEYEEDEDEDEDDKKSAKSSKKSTAKAGKALVKKPAAKPAAKKTGKR